MNVGKARWWVVKVESELTRRLLGMHRKAYVGVWCLASRLLRPLRAETPAMDRSWVRSCVPTMYVAVDCNGRVGDGGGVGRSSGGVSRTVCGIRCGADERLCDENDDERKVMVAVGMLGVGVAVGCARPGRGRGSVSSEGAMRPCHIGLPSWDEFELSCVLRPRDQ